MVQMLNPDAARALPRLPSSVPELDRCTSGQIARRTLQPIQVHIDAARTAFISWRPVRRFLHCCHDDVPPSDQDPVHLGQRDVQRQHPGLPGSLRAFVFHFPVQHVPGAGMIEGAEFRPGMVPFRATER